MQRRLKLGTPWNPNGIFKPKMPQLVLTTPRGACLDVLPTITDKSIDTVFADSALLRRRVPPYPGVGGDPGFARRLLPSWGFWRRRSQTQKSGPGCRRRGGTFGGETRPARSVI